MVKKEKTEEVVNQKEKTEEVQDQKDLLQKGRDDLEKIRMEMRKKKEAKDKRLQKEIQKDIESINKKNKTKIITFGDNPLNNIQWVDTGIPQLNEALSGDPINGGWPRGRFIELFGPEGHGKTWILSRTYAINLAKGLKCLHIDAEGTYNEKFAAMHGVDALSLHYSNNDCAEEIMENVENLCLNNEYDVIGIDSLASLVPMRVKKSEMGKEDFSPLAATISRCIPRVSSVLKKSKTVLILVNQLRDSMNAYGAAEHTPGGRAVKFYASLRVDARKRSIKKQDRPELFQDNKPIGHVLHIKTSKNKMYPPFKDCDVDVWYQVSTSIVSIVAKAIEEDVIERQRTQNTDELRGKKLTYKGQEYVPQIKYDAEATMVWLRENGLLCNLLADMGVEDFDEFILNGDITEDDVVKFLSETNE